MFEVAYLWYSVVKKNSVIPIKSNRIGLTLDIVFDFPFNHSLNDIIRMTLKFVFFVALPL